MVVMGGLALLSVGPLACGFVPSSLGTNTPQGNPVSALRGAAFQSDSMHPTNSCSRAGMALCAVATVLLLRSAAAAHRRAATGRTVRACDGNYGEHLGVPSDSYVVLGLAHCFEQVQGKLTDVYVLEPVSASTVEVIENGAQTSYEAFVGTTVGEILAQDANAFPAELLCGKSDVRFGERLEFRTGCAARTWMREHASEVVKKLAPVGQVRTGFNTSTEHKRILNFVHEVKDSDNIKQDMSIDAYGREADAEESDEMAAIEDLYNA